MEFVKNLVDIFQVDDKPVITLYSYNIGYIFLVQIFSIFSSSKDSENMTKKSELEKYIPYCTLYRVITITYQI